MSRLDAVAVARELARRGAAIGQPLSVAEETGSTNDDARRAAASGAPHGAAFLADAQTSGRGRAGHTWYSPPHENLYLSLLLRPQVSPAAVAPITLVCGLAVAAVVERALQGARTGDMEVGLKWPNDVLVGGRKIAGVLVEGQLRGAAIQSLVVGVGLNVGARSFPPEIADRATSLALLGAEAPREALAADLITALGDAVARFEADNLAPFAADLARRDWLRGRPVRVGDVAGIAAGIDPEGRLLVQADDGTCHPVVSGEVSALLGTA